jgi:hypothetical protein
MTLMPDRRSPWLGWWRFILDAIDALRFPRADIASADRAVRALARGSWLNRQMESAAALTRRSWSTSSCRALLAQLAALLTAAEQPSRIRTAGWTAAIASATVLLLNALKPVPVGPLSWMLPAIVGASGLLTMAAAEPIARALADRARRP